jgi:ABC-type branched-subunit amino acid transport system permease subunit
LGGGILFYYFSLALVLVVYASLYCIIRSKIGLRFKTIREDELAAQASGFPLGAIWKRFVSKLDKFLKNA